MFQSVRRPARKDRELCDAYVWKRQTLEQLAEAEGKSVPWIRTRVHRAKPRERVIIPGPIVAAADMTFWGRGYGVCVFRDPNTKRNLWWQEADKETAALYVEGRRALEAQGFRVVAAVVDGKTGIPKVFKDVPVQICQFHQEKTVTKYLTRKPKTEAARDLRVLTLTLPYTDEATFAKRLDAWEARYRDFMDEHTICSDCKRKHYVHRRLRSAYRSLRTNLPFLFTYQKYPELNIPNTTNTLDGMFSQLKNKLGAHRGIGGVRRYRIISEILSGEEEEGT